MKAKFALWLLMASVLLLLPLLLASCGECAHVYEHTETVEPTCVQYGHKVYVCKICEDSYISEIRLPFGHKRTVAEVVPASCEEEGYTVFGCERCSDSFIGDYVKPAGHDLTEELHEPDCDTHGYTEVACKNCDFAYNSDYTEPTGHATESTVTQPTCTEYGYTTYSCSECDFSYISDYTAPNGHDFDYTVKDPTCEEEGYTLAECKAGDASFTFGHQKPNGHSLSETVHAPSCEEEGYTEYDCDNCEYAFVSDYISPNGHNYTLSATPPTATERGFTLYDCNDCDYSFEGDFIYLDEVLLGAKGDGEGVLAHGVDLSYHNEEVDFVALKAAGIDFAIIRVGYMGYTSWVTDSKFEEYYAAAKEAGIDLGCYVYSYAKNNEDAEEEALAVIDAIKGKTFEYPIYFDLEHTELESLSKTTLTEACLTFFDVMLEHGYYPALYTNANWLTYLLDSDRILPHYDVWFASWVSEEKFSEYDYSATYGMWQHTDSGTVDGITGACDRNVAFKDYPTIIKKYGFNGFGV